MAIFQVAEPLLRMHANCAARPSLKLAAASLWRVQPVWPEVHRSDHEAPDF